MLKSSICIKVCQGPDCTGLGGGAALLEIEELIQEERYYQQEEEHHRPINTSSAVDATRQQHQEEEEVVSDASVVEVAPIIHYQAEAGGCRNLCTVGPNVYISYQNRKSVLESYHHVKDVSSCREVVQNACIYTRINQKNQTERNEDESCTSSSHQNPMHSNSHENMMTRRVDRKRWEALRNISRVISKCKKDIASSSLGSSTRNASRCKKWKESCEQHLDPLTQVELSAAKTNGSKDRAARRSERLSQNISEKLAKCFMEEESSNEGSGSDSDSSDHSSS